MSKTIFDACAVLLLCCAMFGVGLLLASNAKIVRGVVALSPLSSNEASLLTEHRQDGALRALEYVTGKSPELKPPLSRNVQDPEQQNAASNSHSLLGFPTIYAQDEISHMADVRAVMRAGRKVALLTLAISLVGIGVTLKFEAYARLAHILKWAGVLNGGIILLMTLTGIFGFDTLFTAFHSLFFTDGTWQFPENSLLLSLFPLQFWMIEGAVVVVGSLFAAGAACLASALLRSTYVEKASSGVN